MKVLQINKCSDSMFWYCALVGKQVPFIREINEGYLSREPSGYVNIVKKDDAEIIDTTNEVTQCS
jgi:hypothetical protein